jgi:uncharacterized Fe-S cluster protein YjdI
MVCARIAVLADTNMMISHHGIHVQVMFATLICFDCHRRVRGYSNVFESLTLYYTPDVAKAWLQSAPHASNLKSDFTLHTARCTLFS